MRWLFPVLVLLLLWLQLKLWVGEGSLAHKSELDHQIDQQAGENEQLQERNDDIAREVDSLKNNLDSIEEKAREDLGMIREGETFYLTTEEDSK